MPHRIFLSHNHNDKPVVEGVALRLAGIFGKENVFYDSWSIKPGDGIIDQMNKGLEAPEFVFFFVSEKSLASEMVKLEWQNALYAATRGKMKIIPVRVDGVGMPPVLMQSLYIDMHTIGLEAAISQIVSVTQGNVSFTPQHQGFSNLSVDIETTPARKINIVVRASHLMEPNPNFMILVENPESEVSWGANGSSFIGGFNSDVRLDNGKIYNGIVISPMNAALTPSHPIRLDVSPTGSTDVKLVGVLHQASEKRWVLLPAAQAR